MNIDIIFKIGGIGIVIAIINRLLIQSGRDEQALMVTIAGLVIVMIMLVNQISELFHVVKKLLEL